MESDANFGYLMSELNWIVGNSAVVQRARELVGMRKKTKQNKTLHIWYQKFYE